MTPVQWLFFVGLPLGIAVVGTALGEIVRARALSTPFERAASSRPTSLVEEMPTSLVGEILAASGPPKEYEGFDHDWLFSNVRFWMLRREVLGPIAKRHGNTKLWTLRKVYGENFAQGLPGDELLRDALLKLNSSDFRRIVGDYENGRLQESLRVA
jgi:hypothetical protein